MSLLSELFAIVAPVYLIASLGFVWVRSGRSFPTGSVTDLIMLVGAPCLAFSRLTDVDLDGGAMAEMFLGATAALVVFAAIGSLVLKASGLSLRTYLGSLVFANTANMGLPVSLLAFGEAGLTLAVCYYAVVATGQFTVGVALYSGRVSLRELARAPLPLVVVIALAINAGDVTVPAWLRNTTELLADLVVPLMQFMLGVSLAGLRAAGFGRSSALALLRVGMGIGVGFALAPLLGLEGVARGVFIVDCAMPAAVFNYLFARRYDRSPEEVASVVLVSTLLAFATLPIVLAFVL